MYCLVTPFSKSFDEIWLIYYVPDFLSVELQVGNIVEIPYGNTIEIALVLDINTSTWDIDESKIKSIISIKNNNVFLTEYQKNILPWLADFYITPIHNVANLFFPRNLLEKIKKLYKNEDAAGVGIITKQNTTQDVKPGETQRQAKKLHLR